MMDEIKGRTELLKGFGEGTIARLPQQARVEIVYLQLRKVIELIAMGSLLANSATFSKVHANIHKYWHAKDLLKVLRGINTEFYPKPIIQRPSTQPGVRMEWIDRKDDFLSQDRFITLYDKCGSILHSRNPFAPEQEYQKLEESAPKWYLCIIHLLDAHLIRLVGDRNMYLIQMGALGKPATYTPFAPGVKPD